MDTKERSIAFKVKVKEEAKAGETIVNKAVVSEPNGQTEHPKKRLRRIINTVKWMLKKRNESNTKTRRRSGIPNYIL